MAPRMDSSRPTKGASPWTYYRKQHHQEDTSHPSQGDE